MFLKKFGFLIVPMFFLSTKIAFAAPLEGVGDDLRSSLTTFVIAWPLVSIIDGFVFSKVLKNANKKSFSLSFMLNLLLFMLAVGLSIFIRGYIEDYFKIDKNIQIFLLSSLPIILFKIFIVQKHLNKSDNPKSLLFVFAYCFLFNPFNYLYLFFTYLK